MIISRHRGTRAARSTRLAGAAGGRGHYRELARACGLAAIAVAAVPALTAAVSATPALAGPAGPAGPGGLKPAARVTGSRDILTAITAIPRSGGAWAVGEKCPRQPEGCTPGNDVILRENRSRWSAVPAPSPGGQASLVSVSADSTSDAWAVGADDGGEFNLYLHWTGRAWHRVGGPTPDGSVLTGVSATSRRSAWAVGHYTSPDGTTVTLALHWNGRSWRKVPTPDPSTGDNELLGVRAVTASNVWAVGYWLDPQSRNQTLILHWNGRTWRRAVAPPVATFGTRLSAIAAASASDAWAVGQYYSGADTDQPLILRWNGRSWSRARLPGAGSRTEMLYGVAASKSSAWAVGLGPCLGPSINCPSKSLIMHWNGRSWAVTGSISISDATNQNSLAGVAVSGPGAWAVGSYFPAALSEPVFALLERWNGRAWSRQ